MENLAGLVAAYGYYDKKIAQIKSDTPSNYAARTGNPVSYEEFDSMRCAALNDLERRGNKVAAAIDALVDKLE